MSDRFVKISKTGKPLTRKAKTWAAVLDNETGVIWQNGESERVTFAKAPGVARALKLAGASDWRVPTRKELLSLVDDTRHSPAIDVDFFPETKSAFYWSSTPVASAPADCAWVVNFYHGGSGCHYQYNTAFVRAVRSASSASQ